jgi:O-antigen/teichoic acid export membrane protein
MSTVRTIAKNTTALFVAEIVSQALRIVYFAILVRYIQDEGMGKISTAQALVATLFVLVSFGFEQLMVRDVAANKARAPEYVSNVGFIRIVLSLVFALALWMAVQMLGFSSEVATLTYIYGLAFVFKAFTDVALGIYQAFEKMEYNLITHLAREAVNMGLSLLAIYLRYSLIVIVSVSAIANLIELMLAVVFLRRQKVPIRFKVDLGLSYRLVIAALPFALVSIYPLAQSNLNTLILSTSVTAQEVGWFAAATTLIGMVKLIPVIFMRAMFPVFSRASARSDTSLQKAYQKSFTYLLILGLAVSVGTFLTADRIVPLVFGDGFEQAVAALRVLAWVPLVGFVGHANGNVLIAMGREKLFMATEGVFAVVYAALAFALVSPFGYIGASYAMLLPTVVGFVFYTVMCHRLLGLSLPWKRAVAAAAAAGLMAACVYYSLHAGINLFAVILLIAPVVYGSALYLLRVLSREDLTLLKQALKS